MKFMSMPNWAPEDEGAGAGAKPVEEAKPAAEAAKPTEEAKPAEQAKPAAEAKPTDDSWKDRRIAELTSKLHTARQAAVKPAETLAATAKPVLDPTTDFNARVNAAASQQVAEQRFADDCNAAVAKGRELFGKEEFNERIDGLKKLVDANDPASLMAYNQMLIAALDTGEAHAVIFELGGNLNEAQRILGLTPTKMAIALDRLIPKGAKDDTAVSGLPKPIRPIESRGARHDEIPPDDTERSDTLDTATWMARREKQVAGQPRR